MRNLSEKEQAQMAGDKLAIAVKSFLKEKIGEEELCLALMEYCKDQSWNGPCCSWTKDIIDFEAK